MASRPLAALAFGAVLVCGSYGVLVATGQVRGFWEPQPDFSGALGAALHAELNVREGDRRHNNRNRDLPEQAPLTKTELYPEEPDWWRNRCKGFFSALFRANLDIPFRLQRPEVEHYFPELQKAGDLAVPDAGNAAAMDHMARYERTLPLDPEEIRGHPVFVADLPICLAVAEGIFPAR